MKKTLVIVAAFASLAFLLTTSAQSQSDAGDSDLDKIRLQIAELQLKVSSLEHAAGKSGGAASGSAAAAPVHTMVLVSINQANHAHDNSQEIASLQRQSDALWNTVNSAAEQTANDAGQQLYAGHVRGGVRGWGGGVGGGVTTSNVGAVKRQVEGDKQIEQRYTTQHAITKRKLDALEAANRVPRQILVGHNGETIFTLETKHNLTADIDKISIGDTVTWGGQRVSADHNAEVWEIEMIKKVEQ